MTQLVSVRGATKRFGQHAVLDNVDFSIEQGRIIGLIGPNGAGKTTLLRAILGLTDVSGDVNVLGFDPRTQRDAMMEKVAYIPDVAILPRWMRVQQIVDYVAAVHPRFQLPRCEALLAKTQIPRHAKVSTLSKGMVAQLHLALTLAIDAELLILDEPTLGLDILYRKAFYDYLLEDYHERNRTIVITTHQVEEIEHLLTDVAFIANGKLALCASTEDIATRFTEVLVSRENADSARALKPLSERSVFGKSVMVFENVAREQLQQLGELRTPGIADVFVAKMMEARS